VIQKPQGQLVDGHRRTVDGLVAEPVGHEQIVMGLRFWRAERAKVVIFPIDANAGLPRWLVEQERWAM
jgi:hypothetical protein